MMRAMAKKVAKLTCLTTVLLLCLYGVCGSITAMAVKAVLISHPWGHARWIVSKSEAWVFLS